MFKSILFVLLAMSWSVSAVEGISAKRDANVSFKIYQAAAAVGVDTALPPWTSPTDEAEAYHRANLRTATVWENYDVMLERFKEMRDQRFLNDSSKPNFMRRISWLYPDDGCFARASLGIRNMFNASYPAPDKVYVFGDLTVQSANAQGGSVSWWYHVAPIVEVAGVKYVLDPAMEPSRPLTLPEWLARMSPSPDYLEVALCAGGTYTPYDNCERTIGSKEEQAVSEQGWFLPTEWSRLQDLGRNPERELGDNPPWL